MADVPPTESATAEARLSEFLASELHQAEVDFPHLARRQRLEPRLERRSLPLGIASAAVLVVLVLVVIGPRLIDRGTVGTGAIDLGADGLPMAIGGEPVLRADQVAASYGKGSFLAGGTLILDTSPCISRSARAQLGCGEGWELVVGPAGNASAIYVLDNIPDAPGFVRTSGAPTVARVHAPTVGARAMSPDILVVESVVWRQPTKGPIPDNVSPPEGGPLNEALVPDFVSAFAGDGLTIAGYVPKRFILGGGALPGSPSDPPQTEPAPVFADDLATLVGHMVPGAGFVALGSSPVPTLPSPTVARSFVPSFVPSPTPTPTPSDSTGVLVDCGGISPKACATAIDLVRAEHEAEVAGATRIVMADTCPPPVVCDRLYPFDAIVVFVTAGGDTTGWYAFSVVGLEYDTPTTVRSWVGDIPDHVLRMLTKSSPAP